MSFFKVCEINCVSLLRAIKAAGCLFGGLSIDFSGPTVSGCFCLVLNLKLAVVYETLIVQR